MNCDDSELMTRRRECYIACNDGVCFLLRVAEGVMMLMMKKSMMMMSRACVTRRRGSDAASHHPVSEN